MRSPENNERPLSNERHASQILNQFTLQWCELPHESQNLRTARVIIAWCLASDEILVSVFGRNPNLDLSGIMKTGQVLQF